MTNSYFVTVNQPDPYNIGVNYEIPTKSVQYGNVILDSINSLFNGTSLNFPLAATGTSYLPVNDQQLIVSKNNLILEPVEDFTISGSNIIFTTPPTLGDDVFIIALATTADLTRTINYVIDSGSSPMLPGKKGKVTLDVSGIIDSVKIFSDQTGGVVFEISKSNYTNYPTFTSITAGQRVQLINNNKYFDDILNNWDKTIVAGDILDFEVISVSNIRRFLISLKLKL